MCVGGDFRDVPLISETYLPGGDSSSFCIYCLEKEEMEKKLSIKYSKGIERQILQIENDDNICKIIFHAF